MLIDKTHSKKDIIQLFKNHGVKIDNKLSKAQIVNNLDDKFQDLKFNDRIKNITEFNDYLKKPTPKQRPNAQQKTDIMFKAKKIIRWSNGGYMNCGTIYSSNEEAHRDIMDIYMWGDLSSIRRACRLYNANLKGLHHVNPILSYEVQEELNNNKIIKKSHSYKLIIRYATKENPIVIDFS
tara:strand:+ start:10734 stop:11273 length:540 start_codon:yes stop_codon:yes gene_type:complete